MEQVFRIEIPIDVKQNADTASIQQLEAALQKVFTTMKSNQGAMKETFQAVEHGAQSAESAIKQAANGSEQLTDSLQNVSETAEQTSGSVENVGEATTHIDKNGRLRDVHGRFVSLGKAAQDAGSQTTSAFGEAGSSADKFSQRVEKTQRTLRGMLKEKVKLALEAVDKISPVLTSVKNGVKSLAGKAWRITVRMADFVTAPFRRLYHMITSPITLALSFAGIGMGASDFLSTFTSFSAGMSTVQALTGATNEEFLQLTETAENLGATTKFTASEASEGMKYLAMAGWETADIIEAMPGLLNLAAAGATDLGTAADIVSDVMTSMGMASTEASRAADVFAKTATSSNTTIEGLGNTLKYAAPIAHSFGLTLEDVAAAAGLMANAGIKGEMAGTALRASLLRMSSPTSEMQKALDSLGISFTENGGKMKSLGDIIRTLETSFAGLSESEKLAYAQDIFGTEAASAWLGLISQGADEYDRMAESLYNCAGSAEQMANTQLDNLTGDMTLLQSAVDGMKISIMTELDPYLRSGVQWLTGKIPQLTDAFTSFVTKGIDKAKELKDFLAGVFSSNEFQHADGFAEKFFVAWDKVIAEPLSEWWQGGGKEKTLGVLGDIGTEFGNLLHGLILGAIAAIKGEEIDFEGMNISGIAKIGAESGKEFISSFAGALDIGGLLGALPGIAKAGIFGSGALKIGSGVASAVRTFSQLKLAFGGVSTAAAAATGATTGVGTAVTAAAAGAAQGASGFSLLGSALSAIPVWGWVAAAALTAVAVGVTAYEHAQSEHEQELLHTGEAAKETAEKYEQSASTIREAMNTLDDIKEIELKVKQAESNSEVITQFQEDMSSVISDQTAEIVVQMSESGLTREQAQEYADDLVGIFTRQAEIEVMLNGSTLSPEEIAQYKTALDGIQSKEAVIEAKLAEGGLTKKEIEDLSAEYASLKTQEAALTLSLDGAGMDKDQLKELSDEYASLESKTAIITAAMSEAGMSQDDIQNVVDTLAGIADKTAVLNFSIAADGLGVSDLEQYNTQLQSLYGNLVELSGGIFTQEDVESGRVTQEDYDQWIAEETIRAENERRDFRRQVQEDAANVPEIVQKRDEARNEQAAYDSVASGVLSDQQFLSSLETQRQTLLSQYQAGEIDADTLFSGGADIIQSAREHQWSDILFGGGPANFDAMQPDMLFGQYTGGFLGIGSHWEADSSINPFGSAFDELARQKESYDSTKHDYAGDATSYDDALLRQYSNEVRVQEMDNFAGFGIQSEYSTATISELANSYSDLDSAGQQMFANAVAGISQVNEAATYVTEEQKVNLGVILGQAQQSVETAANVDILADVAAKLETIQTEYSGLQGDASAAFNAENIDAVNAALDALGVDNIENLDQINTALSDIAAIDPSGLNFDNAAESLVTLGGNADDVKGKVEAAHTQLEALAGTYNVVIEYTQRGTSEAALPSGAVRVRENANGGIYDGAFLSWVAEDGPEAIIPLGTERRERGLDLWLQAGEMLGVAEYADGGILSPYANALSDLPDEPEDGGAPRPYPLQSSDDSPRSVNITIELPDSPTYNIETDGDSEDIIDKLREHQRELAELFGSAIADQLEDIISNMA